MFVRNHPIQFVEEAARRAYDAEVTAALRGQRSRYAVAPRCAVPGREGRVFKEGEAIEVDDLLGEEPPDRRAALQRFIRSGIVLEVDDDHLEALKTSPTARFVTSRALLTRRGLLGAGREVTAEDFESDWLIHVRRLVAAGVIEDRHAPEPYPDDHFTADPGTDAA